MTSKPEPWGQPKEEMRRAKRFVAADSVCFYCPKHGLIPAEKLRTDKTCHECGALLVRAAGGQS